MKSLHSKISAIAPFVFFPLLVILRKKKKIAYIFLYFIIFTLSSCYLNFYRTNTKQSIDANTASTLTSERKYFIIHFNNSTNGLEDVYINHDSIYGKIVVLPLEHSKYLHPTSFNNKNRVKYIDKKNALVEVHLYTNASLDKMTRCLQQALVHLTVQMFTN